VDAEVASQPLRRMLDVETRWQIFSLARRESDDAKV
jgi:hypothetical protein